MVGLRSTAAHGLSANRRRLDRPLAVAPQPNALALAARPAALGPVEDPAAGTAMSYPVVVLDIETVLDREAIEQAHRTGPAAFLRSWLHRVVSVSTLRFSRDEAGRCFDDFALRSLTAPSPGEEPALLDFVETQLAPLGETGRLVTYNGTAHDLPVLLHRRWAAWQFSPSRVTYFSRQRDHHDDVMLQLSADGALRWPALIDVCAALGIPCHPLPPSRQAQRIDPMQVKGQTDVCATYVLHCLQTAQAAGSTAPLARGWTALADYLLGQFPAVPHLTQFATTPMALVAREKAQAAG